MSDRRITDLPKVDGLKLYDSSFPVVVEGGVSASASIGELVWTIKEELGYYKKPLKKCSYCGQWGAVYCACIKCGAPIDP